MNTSWSAPRLWGALMIAAILAGALALAHHPVLDVAASGSAAAALGVVDATNRWVHGASIAAALLLALGLATYTQMRGWHRALPRSAALLFLAGMALLVQAGLVNGFIAPELVRSGAISDPGEPLARLLWVANQRLTVLGSACACLAMALWSLDLAVHAPRHRVLAIAGLLLAIATAVLLWRAGGRIDVARMQGLWALIGGWCLLPAGLMVASSRAIAAGGGESRRQRE